MKKSSLLCIGLSMAFGLAAQYNFESPLYGAAYYHEYMPYSRLDKDIAMMKDAGLTRGRIILGPVRTAGRRVRIRMDGHHNRQVPRCRYQSDNRHTHILNAGMARAQTSGGSIRKDER